MWLREEIPLNGEFVEAGKALQALSRSKKK
jgi:hypothetical protein